MVIANSESDVSLSSNIRKLTDAVRNCATQRSYESAILAEHVSRAAWQNYLGEIPPASAPYHRRRMREGFRACLEAFSNIQYTSKNPQIHRTRVKRYTENVQRRLDLLNLLHKKGHDEAVTQMYQLEARLTLAPGY